MRRRWLVSLPLLALLAAAFVGGRPGGLDGGSLFEPDATRLEECPPDSVACLGQALGNLAWSEGPESAMRQVRDAFGSGTLIERACHTLTHRIGAAAYLRTDGGAREAFSIGDNLCNSGYFHGVVQAAFFGLEGTDEPALIERALEICTDGLANGDPAAYEIASRCAHGVGHGAMLAAKGRLSSVLRICDGLLSFPERRDPAVAPPAHDFGGFASTCANGAFMEAFSPTNGESYAEWARDGDPLHPCGLMPDRYARECYTTLISRLEPLAGSLDGVPALCRLAPGPRAGDCLVGYGTQLSSTIVGSVSPGAALLEGCRIALPWLSQCIHATIDALGHHYERAVEVAPYCAALPDGWLATLCGRTIGWTTGNERRDAIECDALPLRLVDPCRLGARTEIAPGGLLPDPIDADYPPDPDDAPWLAGIAAP
jgi:hypothetical protein